MSLQYVDLPIEGGSSSGAAVATESATTGSGGSGYILVEEFYQ